MVRLGFKNIYQIDMCSNEIGFCAQNLVTMLGSIVDIIGGWWVGGWVRENTLSIFMVLALLTLQNQCKQCGKSALHTNFEFCERKIQKTH